MEGYFHVVSTDVSVGTNSPCDQVQLPQTAHCSNHYAWHSPRKPARIQESHQPPPTAAAGTHFQCDPEDINIAAKNEKAGSYDIVKNSPHLLYTEVVWSLRVFQGK